MTTAHRVVSVIAGLTMAATSGLALADYPDRPITVLVPFNAGGTTDLVVRTLEPALERELGAEIVIRNVTGAAGTIAAAEAMQADADGYTMFFTPKGPVTIQPLLRPLPYQSDDFLPVAEVSVTTYATVVGQDSEFNSFEELVTYAQENPGNLRLASTGIGTMPHLAVVALSHMVGLDIKHIPYKASGEVTKAIMGGELDGTTEMSYVAEQFDLKVLSCWGQERCDGYPDVPTMKELGYDVVLENWLGFVAPQGVPEEYVTKFAESVGVALQDESVMTALENQKITPAFLAGEAFQEVYENDAAANLELLSSAGMSVGQ
ncbi:tripartite tricarboxylate transporter substrate binding protein [Halomonas litopenaei]|nr:tripartite tricarboxylate transporter substrate binding protein [Halomonas litopenaei]